MAVESQLQFTSLASGRGLTCLYGRMPTREERATLASSITSTSPPTTLLSPKLCGRPEEGKISACPQRDSRLIGHADLARRPSGRHAAIQKCQNMGPHWARPLPIPSPRASSPRATPQSGGDKQCTNTSEHPPCDAHRQRRQPIGGEATGGTTGPITRRYCAPRRCAIAVCP